MTSTNRYRLFFVGDQEPLVVTATGAMGDDGTQVYTDDSGGVRVEIAGDGRITSLRTTLRTGAPSRAEPLD